MDRIQFQMYAACMALQFRHLIPPNCVTTLGTIARLRAQQPRSFVPIQFALTQSAIKMKYRVHAPCTPLPALSLSPTSLHLPYESSSFTRTKFAFNTHLLVTLIAFYPKLIDSTCVDLISIHDIHGDSTTAGGTWNGDGGGGDETGEIENYNNNIVITIWSCLSDS